MIDFVPKCDVLCIGAGPEQVPGIEIALNLGLRVLAVDRNPNAPGLSLATHGCPIDPIDPDPIIEIAHRSEVKAVLPVPLGILLRTVGMVNDAARLPGISYKAACLCTDKFLMRETLVGAGLPQPKYSLATTKNDVTKKAAELKYPVIVKPRFGSGSRGVFVARNRTELEQNFDWHVSYAKDFPEEAETLVESVILGQEYGLDGVVIDSEFKLLAIRSKQITQPPYRVATRYVGPINLEPEIQDKIIYALQKASAAIQLSNCLIQADIFIDALSEVWIVEIAGRPSGFGLSQKLLPETTGIQPSKELLKKHFNLPYDFSNKYQKVGMLCILDIAPGKVSAIKNTKSYSDIKGVLFYDFIPKIGDIVSITKTGDDILSRGIFIIVADNMNMLSAIWQQVESNFQVVTRQ